MRTLLVPLVFVLSLLMAGCSDSSKPLASGTAVSGTVWQHSLRTVVGSNSGSAIPAGSKVDVFESIIIIHLSDGSRQIVPLDQVSDLKLK